uniref:Chromo domain-containing protein n=1 Tax=Peronospora matthiolae TaxID=2874970 RepID=A0AAV1UFV8_9STRA
MELITPSPFVSQVILQLFRYTAQIPNIKLIRTSSRIVERVSSDRDVNGVRMSYLVRWSGYPPAWDSWKPCAQLIVDVLGLVEQYDETHPLRLKKGRRKTTSPNASTGIARCRFLRQSQKICNLDTNHPTRDRVILPLLKAVQLVPYTDWVALLKPDAICTKFTDPGLTANALDVMDEGIPSLHQGFAVSNTATLVPPMFKERIGEEFFLSTDSFRAVIRWANPPTVEQRDSIPFVSRAGQPVQLPGWRHPRRLHLRSVAQEISVPGLLIVASVSSSTSVTPIP